VEVRRKKQQARASAWRIVGMKESAALPGSRNAGRRRIEQIPGPLFLTCRC